MAKKSSHGVAAEITPESFNRGAAYPYTRRDSILVIGPVERAVGVETPAGVAVAHPGDYVLLDGDQLDVVAEADLLNDFIPVSENKRLK